MLLNIRDLIEGIVRPLTTLFLVAAVIFGFLWRDTVNSQEFLPLVTMVVGFWFGQRQVEKANGGSNGQV